MYSKVKVAGHPLHPMLVGFPVTLYAVTLGCFAAYALGAEPFWFRVGAYANLAGVCLAAVAAVPGFVDWAFGVPTGSPAKATGLAHMACNVLALLVFAANLWLQFPLRLDPAPPVGLSVVLPGVGVLLTLAAGYLGWKMVQTHHVGVDLTPEQERLEPRASPRVERHDPATHPGHGKSIG
jgi:uncharacterized membrane protein